MINVPAMALLSVALQAQLVEPLPRVPLPRPSPAAVIAVANNNRTPAGTLRGQVLTLELDVVTSRWRPEGPDDPEVPILAFAERGGTARVPGPMLRVRQGTEVRLRIRNRSDSALVIGGLRAAAPEVADTLPLAAGAEREVRFRLNSAGTWYYWGAFAGTRDFDRNWLDSQLNGVIVVDRPGARTDDHIWLMSEWFHPYPNRRQSFETVAVINGKGFPHTPRLRLTQDDSVRFRVINTMSFGHPMHLHGFYYRIEEVNNRRVSLAEQALTNTDLVDAGSTEVFSFLPTTPGNWVFHCHFAFHVDDVSSLVGSPRDSAESEALAHASHDAGSHAAPEHSMRGLVIAITVDPKATHVAPSMEGARTMHLYVQRQPNRLTAGVPAVGFMLQRGDSVPPQNRVQIPGPVLELERNKPVRIVVHNTMDEPTSVHWHGLEIESYPDGVPNWSGLGNLMYGQVAARDSFVAEFVPPRSGTYLYHSHLNDRAHILTGMYGALLVTDGPRDPRRDHLIVAGGGGPPVMPKLESPYAFVNGSRSPAPLRLTVGETHRLRLISIHPDWAVIFTMRSDSAVVRWTPIAKDGADLPEALRQPRLARTRMGPGETADFEFHATAPGRYVIDVTSEGAGWQIPLDVIVEAPPPRR